MTDQQPAPDQPAAHAEQPARADERAHAAPTAHAEESATGQPDVDAALRDLDALDDLPVERHVEVLDNVHSRLRDVLSAAATAPEQPAESQPAQSQPAESRAAAPPPSTA